MKRRARPWPSFLAKAALILLLLVMLAAATLVILLDTGPGHRFIADRIAAIAPSSGLKIRIGRIEGSIWGDTRLRDVRLYDPQGLFAESPLIRLDWQPVALIANRLDIDGLQSALVDLHRLPVLRPSAEPKPILPEFDIRIGRLAVAQLRVGVAVTGQQRLASVAGKADIRSGRAMVDLDVAVKGSGERLAVTLDAEPDRDHFDLDLNLAAPANSLVGALVGTRRPVGLVVKGDGRWSAWAGTARLDLSGRRTASFDLNAESGNYALSGWMAPSQFLTGKLSRLTGPRLLLNGRASLADRQLAGNLSFRSAALKAEAKGRVDLAASGFGGVAFAVDLLRPSALFPNMTGRDIRLAALLDGPFARARFAYRLTASRVAFDKTGFEQVRAEGRGRLSKPPVAVPILLTARRVTGVGDVAGGILANLRVRGQLKVTRQRLVGDGLSLTSDKLKGRLSLLVDLVTGRYDVILSGGLTRYFIPGLGIVDVATELKVVPGQGGRGTLVTGKGRAWVRRLDNKFLAGLAGGLPQIETDLVRAADNILHFRNLRLVAPSISIAGSGFRRRDGTFLFEGNGRQSRYGPFALALDGRIDRPKMAIRLARPNEALGLADVVLNLDPTEQGFAYRAAGMSTLGPFTSNGAILLPRGQPALVRITVLHLSNMVAAGTLRSDPGGFTGRLEISGGGLRGSLAFDPVRDVQRIAADISAADARFAGPPPIALRSGRLEGVVLLDPAGMSMRGTLTARGLSRGALSLANLNATGEMRAGTGRISIDISGTRGRAFALRTAVDFAPGRVRLTGGGTVDRRPIRLTEPALLVRAEDGWRLSSATIDFEGGSAALSGLFDGSRTEIDARLQGMPLTVLDIASPGLGLGGMASGTFRYALPKLNGTPTGSADIRVRGLTRSGLVLSSKPVDIGLVAKLDGRNAAMRAVAVSEGRTIGRAQARLSPVPGSGAIGDRLSRAPLAAQLRYNGPADTLWRLTGIELLDVSGPVAIGADLTGSLRDPAIRGSLRAEKARVESAVTGMVLDNVRAGGRFDGSRLMLDTFSGTTKRDGTVSGRGMFDLAAERGFAMNVTLQTDQAQLIDRDDLRAQVTGPIAIRSDGGAGTISGQVQLTSGSFRLGSATTAARLPRLEVREVNRPDEEGPPPRRSSPWKLDLDVNARNRLMVTGLGINSEWSADLKIRGTVTEPRIEGDANLVRGSYDFAGRRFDLERGKIRFLGESPINPVLDITAEGGVQGLNAIIRVTGRGQKPEIAFTSTLALPQDELLSRLLFGTSITSLSAPEALQLAAAVAALNDSGGGLDPINAVRSATGLDRLRIVPADISTGQGTAIGAGKYLGRRVYVEVVTDGRGYSATLVEYQITRWLSLLSSISTIGRESVNIRISKDY
ncbi:translocation/assembly module TamB domain-containing protein [Sphingosinicella rhizophila]|uniref:Translocation/assembly module TamB domain-containing protein n=1 Tax=Sphingosinicella rhizophila TaxID=3050082 RepID=A0ABU3Q461_9SPHN|nr:translocation/assembly module TamB domain-containing protein [Sphingosinicella sp. GR2756]MDT9598206.1 translocation/assembly module TamB domain-containing protein [Sphingosinicella sp. GR2756]